MKYSLLISVIILVLISGCTQNFFNEPLHYYPNEKKEECGSPDYICFFWGEEFSLKKGEFIRKPLPVFLWDGQDLNTSSVVLHVHFQRRMGGISDYDENFKLNLKVNEPEILPSSFGAYKFELLGVDPDRNFANFRISKIMEDGEG